MTSLLQRFPLALSRIRGARTLWGVCVLAACTFAVSACAAGPPISESRVGQLLNRDGVYTLVNLHPDEARGRLYAANYQQDGLIPAGSEVVLEDLNHRQLRFQVVDSQRTYTYVYHNAAVEPLVTHLEDIFGTEDPSEEIAGLSEIDQEGIAQGRALPGMTKRGVWIALGPPPLNRTPDRDSTRWIYWTSRWAPSWAVVFDSDGIVVEGN